MRPTVLSVRSSPPPFCLGQSEFYESLGRRWWAEVPGADRLTEQVRVKQRYMFWDPREALDGPRSVEARMKAFESAVTDVASRSVGSVLEGHDLDRVGSFVTATNTGYFAPMFDCEIMRRLGLRTSLRRTVVGSMGCFAAFNALNVGLDALSARPDELVLVNCTEASSLHMRPESSKDQAIVNLLFGDASASMLMGVRPDGEGLQVLRTHTEQIFGTEDLMTLRITDQGFRMTLSPYVPLVLADNVERYLGALLGPARLEPKAIRHWGIHPGGPRIVDSLAERLGLAPSQVRASRSVLEQHGNCAAATSLLVLEDILRHDDPRPGEFGVLMSFGPGLTIEGALVRF
jgi:predicted naringenin-chalcone synthase